MQVWKFLTNYFKDSKTCYLEKVAFYYLAVFLFVYTFLICSYAPWCPACKSLAPIWEALAFRKKDLKINVGKVDVTDAPGLSGRFMVTALPTIYQYVYKL